MSASANNVLRIPALLLAVVILIPACTGDSPTPAPGEEQALADEAAITQQMIEAIKSVSKQRHPDGHYQRFNQSKTLGCPDARFVVNKDIDERALAGVFRPGVSYPAVLRFANASETDDTKKDFRGLSIKLHNVPGPVLWGREGEQDFVLNSYPALFAANPADFLAFIEATERGQRWRYFVRPSHLYSLRIILEGRERIDNPLSIPYYSTTPYRLGEDRSVAVKYAVRPCTTPTPSSRRNRDPDHLVRALSDSLTDAPACLDFLVQFQKGPGSMPVENAAVIWDENESPFIPVAKINIPSQKPNSKTLAACEALTFNPWQSLAAHRPIGGINRVRKAVYAEIGRFRTGLAAPPASQPSEVSP